MSAPISEQDVVAINANIQKGVSLALETDWDRYMDLFTDDVVVLPTDAPVLEGKKAVRTFLDKWPPIKAYEAQIVQAEGREDFAWVRCVVSETVEPEPGRSLTMKGKQTATYRKQPDGSWLCASLIWNLDEPPTTG